MKGVDQLPPHSRVLYSAVPMWHESGNLTLVLVPGCIQRTKGVNCRGTSVLEITNTHQYAYSSCLLPPSPLVMLKLLEDPGCFSLLIYIAVINYGF